MSPAGDAVKCSTMLDTLLSKTGFVNDAKSFLAGRSSRKQRL